MSDWPLVNLGEVVRHRSEFFAIDDSRTYQRCRVQLHAQGIVLRDEVQGFAIKTKEQQACKTGELLVAEIDAKVGGYGIVPQELDGAIVSSHYFLFEVNGNRLDEQFLEYYIRTPAFRDQVSAQGSTNYAAIRPAHVLGYQIPLPPLAEQRRIVARIAAVENKIGEAQQLRRLAVQETATLRSNAAREFFKTRPDWHVVPLHEVCTAIIDCLHSNPIYSDGGIATVRSPDVGWGTLLLETARRTSQAEYERRTSRGVPAQDDIILVREGGGTGKAAIVRAGEVFSLGQRVMMLRPDRQKVLPKFLLYQWLAPLVYVDQITDRMKGSASPHLNIGALRQFTIQLPPLSEQARLVEHLDRFHSAVDHVCTIQAKTAAEIDAMLPAILDRAFRGEL
ncbi:MAG: restriction endonuclease subunit S [Bryobacteraceae bacterium]|nr:restriction endonuclease subunit S [Bryobacteraceae bacterium]